jgi:hypothetical protein
MSRTNNSVCYISVPNFATLSFGILNYSVHITLNITKEVAEIIKKKYEKNPKIEVFFWNKKWHLRVCNYYEYSQSVMNALYTDAYITLKHMKIMIREAKIEELKNQVEAIKSE